MATRRQLLYIDLFKLITIESKAHAGYQRSINEQLNRQTSSISKHVNSMNTRFDSNTKTAFFVVASPIIRLPQSPSVRIINICLGFKTVLVWSL